MTKTELATEWWIKLFISLLVFTPVLLISLLDPAKNEGGTDTSARSHLNAAIYHLLNERGSTYADLPTEPMPDNKRLLIYFDMGGKNRVAIEEK